MANDFDLDKYLEQNAASQAGSNDQFNVDQYIMSNKQHLAPAGAETQTPSPDWTKAQSFGQGALQGATAGFSDELGGALGAGMEKLAGNPSNKSFKELYKEYRDFQRQRNEAAQKANPASNLAGNVTGAVGSALLAPEALAPKTVTGAAGLGAVTGLGTSEQDLTEPSAEALKGTAQDIATGGALGAAGGALGKGIQKVFNPETLDVAASKAASKAVGIKPSKELTRVYDPSTGKVTEGSDVIKGIGKSAMEEGALPFTGGAEGIYDKTIDAIDNQYSKLNPLMTQTQQKLNQNLDNSLQSAGGIGQKAADFMYDFRNSLEENPNQDKIMKKIETTYLPYIQKLTNADGNLQKLVMFKKGLQETAEDLSAAAYDQPASDLKPEAEFVKRLGGIVRQHIEDLADTVDPDAAQQISDTNKTLSNLYSYKTAVKKLMDKGEGSPVSQVLNIPSKIITGQPLDRLTKIATAKALNQTSKAIQTPVGDLAQKAVVNVPLSTVTNPFTQGQVQQKYNPSEVSKLSTNLYNATDDSLKQVASQFKQTPGLQFYGDHLDKAIDTQDDGEKNRAIFLIMQNPAARKLVTPNDDVKKQDEKSLQQFINR